MSKIKFKNKKLYEETMELIAIGNRGVQTAIKQSFRKGIPVVFGFMDSIIYRFPDGTITTRSPFGKLKPKKKN